MPTVHQRHGQTDERTTYDSNTVLALRTSRGNKMVIKGPTTPQERLSTVGLHVEWRRQDLVRGGTKLKR